MNVFQTDRDRWRCEDFEELRSVFLLPRALSQLQRTKRRHDLLGHPMKLNYYWKWNSSGVRDGSSQVCRLVWVAFGMNPSIEPQSLLTYVVMSVVVSDIPKTN